MKILIIMLKNVPLNIKELGGTRVAIALIKMNYTRVVLTVMESSG